jgi:hypothetical protein
MSKKVGVEIFSVLDRRAALAKLGLGIAAAYVAPMVVKLSEARASGGSGGSGGGGEGGSGGSGGSGADAAGADAAGAESSDGSGGSAGSDAASAPSGTDPASGTNDSPGPVTSG